MVTGESRAWIGTNSGIISLPYDPDNLTLVKEYEYQCVIPTTTFYNDYGASQAPTEIDNGLTYPPDISEYKKIQFDINMDGVNTSYSSNSSPYNGTAKVTIGFGTRYRYDHDIYEGMMYEFNPNEMTSFANWHLTAHASVFTHNWYPLWNEGIPNIACYGSHNTGSHYLNEFIGYLTPYSNSNGHAHPLYQYTILYLYDSTNDGSSNCTISGTIKLTMKCYR